jgi:hypothetical protein
MKLVCEQEQLGTALGGEDLLDLASLRCLVFLNSLSLLHPLQSSHTCTLIYDIILIDPFECLRNLYFYSLDVLLHFQLFRNLPLFRKLNISEVRQQIEVL